MQRWLFTVTGGGNGQLVVVANLYYGAFVCPLLLVSATASTLVKKEEFCTALALRLKLLLVEANNQEVFLHYCRQR